MSGASGFCPRCGTVVSTMHTKPECDARYDLAYVAAKAQATAQAQRATEGAGA